MHESGWKTKVGFCRHCNHYIEFCECDDFDTNVATAEYNIRTYNILTQNRFLDKVQGGATEVVNEELVVTIRFYNNAWLPMSFYLEEDGEAWEALSRNERWCVQGMALEAGKAMAKMIDGGMSERPEVIF